MAEPEVIKSQYQMCGNPYCDNDFTDLQAVVGKDNAYCSEACRSLSETGQYP